MGQKGPSFEDQVAIQERGSELPKMVAPGRWRALSSASQGWPSGNPPRTRKRERVGEYLLKQPPQGLDEE